MPQAPAGDFDYEVHGTGYAHRRRGDPRIEAYVRAALGHARTVVNVGAGAGSYEPEGTDCLTAVEPSASMRAQRPAGRVRAIDAVAEELPFGDGAFDAAMASVTVHQWRDVDAGLREMRRVSRGPVVILTFDPDALDRWWLADYVPGLFASERRRFPTVEHILDVLGGSGTSTPVPVPADCTDGFLEAFYARPEKFLDPGVRRSQSAWGFLSPETTEAALHRLRSELDSGAWESRYGKAAGQAEFVGSLRLVTAVPDDDR